MKARVLLNYNDFAFFLLKTLKNNYSSASDWWENKKSSFKENTRTFSKNSPLKDNIKISRLKKRL